MVRDKGIFKRQYKRIEQFFTHLPLFAKYLTVMMAMILVSYFVLASALTVFLATRLSSEKEILLTENVKQNASYCEKIFASCESQEELNNALIIICNNLGVTANAIDADVFFCRPDGKVILCKEDYLYSYSPNSDGCMLHKGYQIPSDIMSSVSRGYYFSGSKIDNLYSEKTFLAGAPVRVGKTVVGAVFAATPVDISLKEYATRIMSLFLSSVIFAIALSFLVVYAFTAKLTNPLRQMSNATKAYAQGDFSKRVKVRGSDEFAELCQNFNRMASALSVLESSRRSFVANVSHELKTPMTTISGFIDGMLDGTIPPEKQGEYLKIVSNETKRLSRLVTSMLNLSKIESGELEPKRGEFDVSMLLVDCILNFEQEIERKNIEITGFDNIGKVQLNADRDMIYQVFYNLIDNAVKFTNDNGEISVFVGENDKNQTIVSIQNTGEGISSEEIGRIFERFYKVDKSRSYDVKSAGLGLYLCKTIVELHGGQIYAESVENEFTRFTIVFEKAIEKNKKQKSGKSDTI